MALNAKLKKRLWMPKWRCGFEHQAKRWCDNSKCQPKTMALKAEMKMWLWTPKRMRWWLMNSRLKKWYNNPECWTRTMALNTKLRRNGGSERQTKNNSYECQAETMTLNAKLKRDDSECRIREWMVALNAKNTRKWWRGKYAPVQHATTTLNPLERSEIDSMSLEWCSTTESV